MNIICKTKQFVKNFGLKLDVETRKNSTKTEIE